MGMTKQQTFRLTVLSASLMTAFAPAMAEDPTVAELSKPESTISIGVGNWSRDRHQQGMFDGMREGKGYGLLDFDLIKRADDTGTWLTLRGRDLGLDTREIRGEWLRQGNIGAYIDYNRIVRYSPYTFNTALVGIGTSTLIVPNTANPPLSAFEPGTKRDIFDVGFFKNLMPGLDFRLSFKNEEKDGTRNWGRGGAPEFAVEPINATTRQVEAKLEYNAGRLQLDGGYYGSWYENNNGGLINTFTNQVPFNAGTQYYLSQPLNNEAHQVFFNGGFNFTPTTRGTFKYQYTHATMDEDLPTKSITGLSLASSPRNLNGEINTTLAQIGITSRPFQDLSLLANVRYHHMQDQTPQARFVWTGTGAPTVDNCNTTQTCVDNTPLSFKTLSGKVEANYRLPMSFSLIGGFDIRNQDRTVPRGLNTVDAAGVDRQRYVPFRSELDEKTYRVQLRRSMTETVSGSLQYAHSKRDGSDFTRTNEAESDEINPIHIADRDRDKVRATLDWTPVDRLSLSFNVEYAKDDYASSDSRPYGLQEGKAWLYSVDASYAFNEKFQVNAWFSYDKTEATQHTVRAPTGTAPLAEKNADLEDVGKGIGIGFMGRVNERLRFGGDLGWLQNESRYPESLTLLGAGTTYPAGITGPLPDIENKLTRLKLFVLYKVQKNGEVRFDYIHERWKTDDWTWQFSDGADFRYGATTDGTTVVNYPKEISNFLAVRYIYKFQ